MSSWTGTIRRGEESHTDVTNISEDGSGKDQESIMVKWKVLSKTTYAWSEAKAFKRPPNIGYQGKRQLQHLLLSLSIAVPNPKEARSSGRGGVGEGARTEQRPLTQCWFQTHRSGLRKKLKLEEGLEC